MRVKFIKSHPDFAYFAGDNANISEAQVQDFKLIERGFVMVIPTEEEAPVNTLPEDLPSRDFLFKNGFESIADIVAVGEVGVAELKGISKKAAGEVFSFIAQIPE